MNKVHLLAPDIISKIAAGEVIDRPASVIKELLENSLDANADSISIELEDAGKKLIKIKDNGFGIEKDDLENIFLRHSTSKIQTADDLFDIHSLGFRGEALYSICAVSDIITRSKTADSSSGWEIHRRGSDTINLIPCVKPNGTEIEVKEIFFNTPARKKFLKSNTSEMNRILSTIIPYALLHPQCAFKLTNNNKTILNLSSRDNIKARIADVLNLKENFLLETIRKLPDQNINISMILGDINIIRKKRDMQFLFINGRPVENKNLSFHLNDIYRLIFPPRHYPFFCVIIDLPPADIDVNIHPTKREVKIKDEQHLSSIVRRICESALMNAGNPRQVTNTENMPERSSIHQMINEAIKERDRSHEEMETSPTETFYSQQPPTEQYSFPVAEKISDFSNHLFEQKQSSLEKKLGQARFVGSFINKYLFFETDKTLLIIDQHAAQERIIFEQFVKQMQDSSLEIQNLLTPYLLNVSPQDLMRWEESRERLSEIGFDTTQFDNETIAIQSHPSLINNPLEAVRELLAQGNVARCDHDQIARRACRASIMAGDSLTKEQSEFQREQLLQCQNPFTCPHGRPTVIEITSDFLDKQFLRT